jgi:hypothetical protein
LRPVALCGRGAPISFAKKCAAALRAPRRACSTPRRPHPRPTGGTRLVPMLHELAEKARRRALVVILSDCFCDGDELRDALQHLRFQKHDLALFHLLDPLELDFEFDRPVRFVDMEGSHSIVTEPATVRAEYQSQLKRFLDKLRDDCHEFNADYRRVTLDQSYGQVLADFLTERARHATRA